MYKKSLIISLLVFIFSGCSNINDTPVGDSNTNQSFHARNKQVSELNIWTISGKIAFINNKKRQSATFYWHNDALKKIERLNLSTVFGINVLELKRDENNFTLNLDDQNYQTQDLDNLIYQLTGLNLPTRAMSYWLKGLPYLPSDNISYHQLTQLPETLTSQYNNKIWQINFTKYHHVGPFQLAKQLTIIQDDLRIKIIIHSWKI